jgi:hypothetical protein
MCANWDTQRCSSSVVVCAWHRGGFGVLTHQHRTTHAPRRTCPAAAAVLARCCRVAACTHSCCCRRVATRATPSICRCVVLFAWHTNCSAPGVGQRGGGSVCVCLPTRVSRHTRQREEDCSPRMRHTSRVRVLSAPLSRTHPRPRPPSTCTCTLLRRLAVSRCTRALVLARARPLVSCAHVCAPSARLWD